MPLFCSPAGVHALVNPQEGECATAQACCQAGILFGLSQHSIRDPSNKLHKPSFDETTITITTKAQQQRRRPLLLCCGTKPIFSKIVSKRNDCYVVP
mmetsp:Transcript_4698/g.7326  ORF Transcript_4698/g.7326 Transcript_4698/m.7326 type:complete len:97 (-) Transcript_4698:1087-1377(-)